MFKSHKQPSLEAGLLIILVVISVFSIGYYSEGEVTGMVSADITGDVVKVTGGVIKEEGRHDIRPNDLRKELSSATPYVGSNGWRYYDVEGKNYKYVIKPNDEKLYRMERIPSKLYPSREVYILAYDQLSPVYLDTWDHWAEPVNLQEPSEKYNMDTGPYIRAKSKEELQVLNSEISSLTTKQKNLQTDVDNLQKEVDKSTEPLAEEEYSKKLSQQQRELEDVQRRLAATENQKKALLNTRDFKSSNEEITQEMQEDLTKLAELKRLAETEENKNRIQELEFSIQAGQNALEYRNQQLPEQLQSKLEAEGLREAVSAEKTAQATGERLKTAKTEAKTAAETVEKAADKARKEADKAKKEVEAAQEKANKADATPQDKLDAANKLEQALNLEAKASVLEDEAEMAKSAAEEAEAADDPSDAEKAAEEVKAIADKYKEEVETAAPPPPKTITEPSKAPPPPKEIEFDYFIWDEKKAEWVKVETPPPTGAYRMVKKGTNEQYLRDGGKLSKLVDGKWDSSNDYSNELRVKVATTVIPTQAPATPMTYEEAKGILQGADLWIDPKTQADIETKLPQIQADLERQGLKTDSLIAAKVYETEAMLFAQAYQKAEALKNQDTSGFTVEQLRKYSTNLKSAQAELKARQEAFVSTAKQARQAIVVYEDVTYNSNKANTDLRGGDDTAKEKAIAFYAQVASGERTDLAGKLTQEEALNKLKTIDFGDAKKIAARIETENTAKLRIEQTEKANLIQKGELVYRNGQYYYQDQKGDDFYYDPANDKIVLIKTPKPEQTAEERAETNQKILNLIPQAERGNYDIDENGNLVNKNDGFVYRLKPTTTGITLEKVGAPDSIFVNGIELERLENYEISRPPLPKEGGFVGKKVLEGSGVYRGSDGILYDQLGNTIPENTEISFTDSKGSAEKPVYVKTYFNIDSGNRQGGETWIKISMDKEGTKNQIELSQDVYKKLDITADDKLQYSATTLQIRTKDNKLKASVQQARTGVKETKIISGYNKEGRNPTTETIMEFGNGVNKAATIDRNKKYEYGYDENKDGKIEGKEKDIRLTTADEAIIRKTDDKKDDLKVIREYSVDEKGKETESKIIVYDANGKPVGYGEDNNKDGKITDDEMHGKNSKGEESTNEKSKNILETLQTQWESRKWFANFEFKLTQYKGLSGWSQLIFSDEELASWREGVDKLFSTFYLGTDYWVSGICARHIPKQQKGLLTMKTKDGLFDIVAHVEGEKATITGPDQTQYLYKLTFSVRNPKYSSYDELKFNVYLYGDKTVQLYPQSIEVKDGESFTRGAGKRENGQTTYDEQHGKPIVQYSTYNYDKICIKFDSKILNAEGDREDEVCNAIVEYKGSPTKYQKKVIGTPIEGAPITAGTEPYQEADF